MAYLGKVDMNDANIRRYTLTSSTASTVLFSALGWTPANIQSLRVTINGVVQQNISLTSTALDLGGALVATDELEVIGIESMGNIITPADNSVSTAKLADDAVTAVKILDNNVTNDKIVSMSANKLTGSLPPISGFALTSIDATTHTHVGVNPYDVSFIAGYDVATLPIDIVVQRYGEMVMARTGTFEGEQAYIEQGPVGSNLIIDIEKNGSSIYSTKPHYLDGQGTGFLQAGVLSTTNFVAGDRVTFRVTQIGSGTAGTGLRFMMKCKV